MFYIISLTHSYKHDKFMTLWRPDNAGYCFSKEQAGVYAEPIPGYHDSDDNMPISIEDAEKLFITAEYDGKDKQMIPNAPAVWDVLGVRKAKDGLVKRRPKTQPIS